MQDDERMVKADGLEDAIIGIGSRINMPDISLQLQQSRKNLYGTRRHDT